MQHVVPYHQSDIGRQDSPTADIHRHAQEMADYVLARDWHLAHIEDRQRSSVGHEAGKTAVAAVTDRLDHLAAKFADRQVQELEPQLEAKLAAFRQSLSGWDADQRFRAERLLSQNGLPDALLPNTDDTDTERTMPNRTQHGDLISWMSHKPTKEEPYGATDQQLLGLVSWAANYAAALAKDPKLQAQLSEQMQLHQEGIKRAVASGSLSKKWLDEKPSISRFVIGDILDSGFTKGESAAEYQDRSRELAVWPYMHFAEDLISLDRTIPHEANHAMSFGFSFGKTNSWLTEMFTDRYACIIAGIDPDGSGAPEGPGYHQLLRVASDIYGGASTPLTDAETSDCYIGPDPRINHARLRRLIRRAYDGLDVIDMLEQLHVNLGKYKGPDGQYSQTQIWSELEHAMSFVREANTTYRRTGDTAGLYKALESYREDASRGGPVAITAKAILQLFKDDRQLRDYARQERHSQAHQPKTTPEPNSPDTGDNVRRGPRITTL